MGKVFKLNVNPDNVSQLELVHESLLEDTATLLKKVKKYPLELRFEGHRFLLANEEEFRSLIAALKSSIDSYHIAA